MLNPCEYREDGVCPDYTALVNNDPKADLEALDEQDQTICQLFELRSCCTHDKISQEREI
jgi:hypothetical protein